jgi:hypothetical protein
MVEQRTQRAVHRYKTILQRVIHARPSGTRQRLATALGTNRSFVSQITNPAYKVAIPAHHVETILEICRFSPADRAQFLRAYDEAHPRQRQERAIRVRTLELTVPDLGTMRSNRLVDEALREMARHITRILQDKSTDQGTR